MTAETEEQRVMMPGQGSWMEWRAVCWSHPFDKDDFVAPWQGRETHTNWIDAQLDAIEHDAEHHPRKLVVKTFDEILHGEPAPEVEPLLPGNALRPLHAL